MSEPFIRVGIRGTLVGGEVWSVNPSFKMTAATTTPSDAVLQDFADAIAALHGGAVFDTDFRALLSSNGAVASIRTEYVGSDGRLVKAAEASLPNPSPGTGTQTKPGTTAVCVSLITGTIGRSYRGRMFLPALNLDISQSTGLIPSSSQQDIAAGAASFHDEVAGAWNGDGSLAGAVYSAKVGVATVVTAYRVGNVPDNLRNRKTGLTESYVTVNA